MTARSATHATFTVERVVAASPSRVFAHYADPALKAQWFGAPDAGERSGDFEFREGGRETNSGEIDGVRHSFDGRYYDIVPNERIVMAYEMYLDGRRISVSTATTELRPDGDGTRIVYTEQGVFLDGLDNVAQREGGTRWLFDRLAEVVEGRAAA